MGGEAGRDLLEIKGLSSGSDGAFLFKDLSLSIAKGENIVFVGKDGQAATNPFKVLMGEAAAKAREFRWGMTTSRAYFPKESSAIFQSDLGLMDWLRQIALKASDRDEEYVRGFLGRMLFSGEEVSKKVKVLSGGEKVRCLLARMMMTRGNVVILDEPTNHLDLESITAVNNVLMDFKGTVLFTSQDREFVNTIASRIVELTPKGVLDESMSYDEYLENPRVQAQRLALY